MQATSAWLPRLTVDLAALAGNYRSLRSLSAVPVAAVVKADAYGLGVDRVAPTLWAAGCRTFFTAHVDEGVALRRWLPDAEIILLVPPPAPVVDLYRRYRLVPALYRHADIVALAAAIGSAEPLPVALHVETGIHRLAFDDADLANLQRNGLPTTLQPVLLMSHLASADEPASALTHRQRERLRDAQQRWPGLRTSIANSAATLADTTLHFDLVRPGLALYGADPASGSLDARLQTVARFDLPVLALRDVPSGATIGYGATFTTTRPTRLAVLAGGYADGVCRLAGQPNREGVRATLAFGATRLPFCGRISMDLTAVDVTDLPADSVVLGDRFEVFGPTIGIDEFARHCQTLPYEILTGIRGRTERRYTGAGSRDEQH